jgi:hypothetical protein
MLTRLLFTLCLVLAGADFVLAAPPALPAGTELPGVGATVKGAEVDKVITDTIQLIIKYAAALAVLMLVFGGYQYLTAGGADDQVKKAHATLLWSFVGLALAILAYALVEIIISINFGAATTGN